jgi:hypothetical protein
MDYYYGVIQAVIHLREATLLHEGLKISKSKQELKERLDTLKYMVAELLKTQA